MWIFSSLGDWIKGLFVDGIIYNFTGMFNDMNARVGDIASQVGQTPAGWNAGIFGLVRTLSDTVVIPIAGMILTFILCYELIHMIIEKNNMHDFDTFTLFKWIFKTFVAVYILTQQRVCLFAVAMDFTVCGGKIPVLCVHGAWREPSRFQPSLHRT